MSKIIPRSMQNLVHITAGSTFKYRLDDAVRQPTCNLRLISTTNAKLGLLDEETSHIVVYGSSSVIEQYLIRKGAVVTKYVASTPNTPVEHVLTLLVDGSDSREESAKWERSPLG